MIPPVWLLGCGHMGGALLRRWIAGDMGPFAVIDPSMAGVPENVVAGSEMPEGRPDVLVLAVQPQVWWEATEPLADCAGPMTLVVSIMAGVTTAAIAQRFPNSPIIRAMPNMPAAIGMGATALFTVAGDLAEGAAEALFGPVGATFWLSDEADFDAVSAISGSGPAYVLAFIEALVAAGEAAGLDAGLSMRLVRATVAGSAALAAAQADVPVAELRERVTSPDGATAAGLAVLQPILTPLLVETVRAAAARGRKPGGKASD